MLTPKFLILNGDGVNCEKETAHAFDLAGAQSEIIHVNELLKNPKRLLDFQGLALPGGFSFGDELGSGQLLALKIKHGLEDQFLEFTARKNPIIGICNGFQVLCKMGLLPNSSGENLIGLARNQSGHFIDRWVDLSINPHTACKWTGSTPRTISLPVRHGEGRVIFKDQDLFDRMDENGQIVLRYSENINGSDYDVAGICDPQGLVFGLMPHPEAFLYELLRKGKSDYPLQKGEGYTIFESIVKYLKER